jgi:catechol 2,3-dioxygenase
MTNTTAQVLPAETHMGWVHLNVSNLARSLGFYADDLGLFEIARQGDTATLSADGRTPLVYLTEMPSAPDRPRGTTGLFHMAIRLPGRPELAALLRRLALRNIVFQGASDHLVSEALYLADPDGIGLELYRDRPRNEWRYGADGLTMSTLPLNLDSLLDEADNAPKTRGIPPATDMGHVHLNVSSLEAAHAFYVGTFGFDAMVRFPGNALFVAAGGYHHHLGLNVWGGKARPPEDVIGLRAYQIIVPDAAERAALRARLESAGYETSADEDGFSVRDMDGNRVVVA